MPTPSYRSVPTQNPTASQAERSLSAVLSPYADARQETNQMALRLKAEEDAYALKLLEMEHAENKKREAERRADEKYDRRLADERDHAAGVRAEVREQKLADREDEREHARVLREELALLKAMEEQQRRDYEELRDKERYDRGRRDKEDDRRQLQIDNLVLFASQNGLPQARITEILGKEEDRKKNYQEIMAKLSTETKAHLKSEASKERVETLLQKYYALGGTKEIEGLKDKEGKLKGSESEQRNLIAGAIYTRTIESAKEAADAEFDAKNAQDDTQKVRAYTRLAKIYGIDINELTHSRNDLGEVVPLAQEDQRANLGEIMRRVDSGRVGRSEGIYRSRMNAVVKTMTNLIDSANEAQREAMAHAHPDKIIEATNLAGMGFTQDEALRIRQYGFSGLSALESAAAAKGNESARGFTEKVNKLREHVATRMAEEGEKLPPDLKTAIKFNMLKDEARAAMAWRVKESDKIPNAPAYSQYSPQGAYQGGFPGAGTANPAYSGVDPNRMYYGPAGSSQNPNVNPYAGANLPVDPSTFAPGGDPFGAGADPQGAPTGPAFADPYGGQDPSSTPPTEEGAPPAPGTPSSVPAPEGQSGVSNPGSMPEWNPTNIPVQDFLMFDNQRATLAKWARRWANSPPGAYKDQLGEYLDSHGVISRPDHSIRNKSAPGRTADTGGWGIVNLANPASPGNLLNVAVSGGGDWFGGDAGVYIGDSPEKRRKADQAIHDYYTNREKNLTDNDRYLMDVRGPDAVAEAKRLGLPSGKLREPLSAIQPDQPQLKAGVEHYLKNQPETWEEKYAKEGLPFSDEWTELKAVSRHKRYDPSTALKGYSRVDLVKKMDPNLVRSALSEKTRRGRDAATVEGSGIRVQDMVPPARPAGIGLPGLSVDELFPSPGVAPPGYEDEGGLEPDSLDPYRQFSIPQAKATPKPPSLSPVRPMPGSSVLVPPSQGLSGRPLVSPVNIPANTPARPPLDPPRFPSVPAAGPAVLPPRTMGLSPGVTQALGELQSGKITPQQLQTTLSNLELRFRQNRAALSDGDIAEMQKIRDDISMALEIYSGGPAANPLAPHVPALPK